MSIVTRLCSALSLVFTVTALTRSPSLSAGPHHASVHHDGQAIFVIVTAATMLIAVTLTMATTATVIATLIFQVAAAMMAILSVTASRGLLRYHGAFPGRLRPFASISR